MDHVSWLGWTALGSSALLIGVSKTGFPGVAILAILLTAMVVPARESTGLILPMLIVGDIFAVAYYRRHAVWKHLVKLIPFAAVGIVIGSMAMGKASDAQVRVFIGSVILAMLALNWVRTRRGDGARVPTGAWFPICIGLAAEVVGYARSHLRDEGLHVLVDIGASTLDVCGFILHAAGGDDCYELLTADVQQLGTMALYRRRVLGVHKAVEAHVAELWSKCDPVKAIPETSNEYLPHSNMLEKYVTNAGEQYEGECRRMLWKTIVDLKTRRDPRSPRWRGELPLFVCGGGSAMAFYHGAISKLSGQLASFYTGCEGIKKCLLPKPEQLVAEIDAQNYHQLAVAWGLSYPEYDIGSVTRPGEIEDVAPPKQIERREEPWER
jgi:hypothetical protein